MTGHGLMASRKFHHVLDEKSHCKYTDVIGITDGVIGANYK